MIYTEINVTEIISKRTNDRMQWFLLFSAIITIVVGVVWQYINADDVIGAYVWGIGTILFVLYSKYAKHRPLIQKQFRQFQGELELMSSGVVLRDFENKKEYHFQKGNAIIRISRQYNFLGMRSPQINAEFVDFEYNYADMAEYFKDWGLQYV